MPLNGGKQGLDDFLVAGGDLSAVLADPRPLALGQHLVQFNEWYAYVKDQDVVINLESGKRTKREAFINGIAWNLLNLSVVVFLLWRVHKSQQAGPAA